MRVNGKILRGKYENYTPLRIIIFIFSITLLLLIISLINKLLVKKFFPYPRGEFVNELKDIFMQNRLSERIYISLKDLLWIAVIVYLLGSLGRLGNTYGGAILNYLDFIIISGLMFFILILRLIFSIYQKIKPNDR